MYMCIIDCIMVRGRRQGAARDTNRLYHWKHLYHYENKSVQHTGSRNVLDLLTTPSGSVQYIPPTCGITITCLIMHREKTLLIH